jgi:hypothetical protein
MHLLWAILFKANKNSVLGKIRLVNSFEYLKNRIFVFHHENF